MSKVQLKDIQDKILDNPSYTVRIWWRYPHIGPWTTKEEIINNVKQHINGKD